MSKDSHEAVNNSCLQQPWPGLAHLHDLLCDAFELSADMTHWKRTIYVLSYVADADLSIVHRALE